jgi:hypothetical protein
MTTEPKWGRRSPKDFTPEMRQEALGQLNDETRIFMSFTHGCVLLDISRPWAYALARKGELVGARHIGSAWKFQRETLKNFLYGKE